MKKASRTTRPGLIGNGQQPEASKSMGWTLDKGYKAFLESRQAKNVSPSTITHYGKTFGLFTRYAKAIGLEYINDVEKRHVEGFFVAMGKTEEEGSVIPNPRGGMYSPTTRHKVAVDLKAMFAWLGKETERNRQTGADIKVLTRCPFENAVLPKAPDTTLPPYEETELNRLLAACEGSHPLRIRDRALILMFLDSGIRREECQELRIRDVNLAQGTITILDGKGGVTRTAVICAITVRAIRKYLDLPFMKEMDESEHLWWGKHGPLGYDGLGEVVERVGRRAKVGGSCHKLRRTAAIQMLRNGADLETVRAFLGHRDYQVIQKYLAYTNEDLKKAHDKYSPVASLEAAKPKSKGLGKNRRRKA